MQSSEFVKKFSSWYLWKNILIMGLVVAVLGVGVKFGLDFYTHHGEAIPVPDLKHKRLTDAEHLLRELGLEIQVVDTGYVKSLPADCILEQSLTPGEKVKSGHIIYVTINSPQTPTITLPDIIDNSSLREAMAKLTAMGYGVLVNGRPVNAGDKISVEATLIIQVGNGERSDDDSVDYIDPALPHPNEMGDDVDEFEVVTGPDSPTKGNDNVKENSAKTMPKE